MRIKDRPAVKGLVLKVLDERSEPEKVPDVDQAICVKVADRKKRLHRAHVIIHECALGAAAFFFLGPHFWIEIPWLGHFDILVAWSCLGAMLFSRKNKDVPAGICLGLGVLLKFIPIVLFPFLVVRRGGCRRFSSGLRSFRYLLFFFSSRWRCLCARISRWRCISVR